MKKCAIFYYFDRRTDGPMDRRTDGPTDRPSYRDVRSHLKNFTFICTNLKNERKLCSPHAHMHLEAGTWMLALGRLGACILAQLSSANSKLQF